MVRGRVIAADPVVFVAPRVCALDQLVLVDAPPEASDLHALDLVFGQVRDVHVEEDIAPDAVRVDLVDELLHEGRARLYGPLGNGAHGHSYGGDLADHAFHSGSDGAGVGDVIAQVVAAVDARDHEIGHEAEEAERHERHTVRGRAVGGVCHGDMVEHAGGNNAQRPVEGAIVPGNRPVAVGGEHGHVVLGGEHGVEGEQPLGGDAVVIGEQYAHGG